MGIENIVIGNPDSAKYLVTAHYDTPASIGLPNILTPCNLLTYLLWQILIVGALIALATQAMLAVRTLTQVPYFGLITWYIVYFGILLLLMIGPANKHNANDNTSGVVAVLEIAGSLSKNQREKVCFVLFDLEEAGLLGSAAFRKKHKNTTKEKIVLNLDCVGDGDEILLFPNKKVKKNATIMEKLGKICGPCGEKSITLRGKGFSVCPSDHGNFPYGVGIAAFRRKKGIGLYCSRIHTSRDTILDLTNINILRSAITTLICQ